MKNFLGGKQLPQKIFSMIRKILFYFIKRIINEGVWPARELAGHNLIFTQFLRKHLHAFHVTRFRKWLRFGQPRRGDAGWHLAVTSACVQSSCLSSGITTAWQSLTYGQRKDTTHGWQTSVLSQHRLKNSSGKAIFPLCWRLPDGARAGCLGRRKLSPCVLRELSDTRGEFSRLSSRFDNMQVSLLTFRGPLKVTAIFTPQWVPPQWSPSLSICILRLLEKASGSS